MVTCIKLTTLSNTMKNKHLHKFITYSTLLALLLLASGSVAAIQTKTINYSVEDGLSQSTVISITQDDLGQMWFGTRNGLNLFNGYEFEIFLHDMEDSTSIINNEITKVYKLDSHHILLGTRNGICKLNILTKKSYSYDYTKLGYTEFVINDIHKDAKGRIWVASREGLFLFDEESNNFIIYPKLNATPGSINSIAENAVNGLWIGTSNGLFKLVNDEWQIVEDYLYNPNNIKNKRITTLCFDRYNDLWVGTRNNGIAHISLKTDVRIKYINTNSGNAPTTKLNSNEIRGIIEDQKGRIWIGTKEGVNIFDPFTGELELIQNTTGIINSISQNSVYSVFEDNKNGIWIGTWSGGVNLLQTDYKGFIPVQRYAIGNESGLFKAVSSLTTVNNHYYVGTENKGIIVMDKDWNTVKIISTNSTNNKLRSNHVKKLYVDHNKKIWIGFYDRGLQEYDPKTGRITDHIDNINIYDITENNDGNFWLSSRKELIKYNKYNKQTTSYIYVGTQESTNQQAGATILNTSNDRLWVGSRFGIDIYNLKTDEFIRHYNLTDIPDGDYSMHIFSLGEDADKNIWIGTNRGLYVINVLKDTIIRPTNNELHKYIIYSILTENQNIWLSTDNGVIKYTPSTNAHVHFSQDNGLQSNEFIRNAQYKTSDNLFLFGGINGFTAFNPLLIHKENEKPFLLISEVEYTDRARETHKLFYPNKIGSPLVLDPSQPNITFRYAAIDYMHTSHIEYVFALEGLLDKWISNGEQRSVSFTKLKPGNYTFRIKMVDEKGQQLGQESFVKFKIKKPFYSTYVAFTTYLLIIASIIYFIAKSKTQKRKIQEELKLKELEHDKDSQLSELKTKFFMNVSHEFRTPLTVIHGPIERMIERQEYTLDSVEAKTMLRNTERLISLLDQLLEFRKVEKGKSKMKLEHVDLSLYAKDLLQLFRTIAYEKNITLEFISSCKVMVWLDRDKMQKIISNLLSNAIKFTPENGRIIIEVSENQDALTEKVNAEISVIDNGIGMDKKQLASIFNRFESSDANNNPKGIGIGLALANELVKQHHGKISVDSEPNNGTAFTISIPKSKSIYSETDDIEFIEPVVETGIISEEEKLKAAKKSEKKSILVIDDNSDIRHYVAGILKDYSIIEAESIEEAENYLAGNMPDIIISDVILPGKNGYEFCQQIKSDQYTSHIPVILMTAKGNDDNRIQGLELGADAFIPKPFNERIMKVWVEKLLLAQQKLFDYYMSHIMQGSARDNKSRPKLKDSFLEKARKIVEKDIANPDLSVEMLSKQMNMSRSNLHLKFKAVINKTPSDFIRIIRLNHAAQLLKNKDSNIVEAAYTAGFNSPSYFTKCFKQHFKMTPTEFVEQQTTQNDDEKTDLDFIQ